MFVKIGTPSGSHRRRLRRRVETRHAQEPTRDGAVSRSACLLRRDALSIVVEEKVRSNSLRLESCSGVCRKTLRLSRKPIEPFMSLMRCHADHDKSVTTFSRVHRRRGHAFHRTLCRVKLPSVRNLHTITKWSSLIFFVYSCLED